MKKTVLFVDDEPSVLNGLRRTLRTHRDEWELLFASNGNEALAQFEQHDIAVIVSDMRMPGMNGAELLEKVALIKPDTVRIILSGHSDEELILRSAGIAHQFLAKPTSAMSLYTTIKRTFALRGFINNRQLHQFVTGMKTLPSLPTVYIEMMEKLRSENASLADIGGIIAKDPAMSTKVLQLVNSAFYGLGHKIANLSDASAMIGLNALKSLVLNIGIFAQFNTGNNHDARFSLEAHQLHSLKIAEMAKRVAQSVSAPQAVVDESFLAGLVHDIGMLVIEENYSNDYLEVRQLIDNGSDISEAEMDVFGTTHSAVGAYILGLWGLPDDVVEAVAFHHKTSLVNNDGFCPLVALHVAHVLLKRAGQYDTGFINEKICFDENLLERTGMLDNVETWESLKIGDG